MTLGEKIRKLRQEKKMTLQNVSDQIGYSKALISRIENDSVSPSISSLIRLASVLQIGLHELFAAVEGGQTSVVKKNDRESRIITGSGIKVERARGGSEEGKMMPVIMTFEPGAHTEEKGDSHTGEEWWYVLKGKLEATIGEKIYQLCEGDCIYLDSAVPHNWRNMASGKTSALVIVASLSS